MAPSSPSHLITRAWFKFKLSSGMLQRQSPALPWAAVPPFPDTSTDFLIKWKAKSPNLPIALLERSYLAPHLEQSAVELGHSPEAEAKAIAVGRFRLTNGEFINLGWPPEWHHGSKSSEQLHWTKISTAGRVEDATEVSQFNWAYALVRAWILSGDDAHAEAFWALLEDWLQSNPPLLGLSWVSDDAIARRLIAVIYATQALRFHPSTTDERILKVARFVTVSAERLHLTFSNAGTDSVTSGFRSALALFSAGALWPQLPTADIWRSSGLEFLINEGKKVMNREVAQGLPASTVALQLLEIFTWTEIILRSENEKESLPEALHAKIRTFVTTAAGSPAIALISSPLFYLSGCSTSDARPAIATALILFTGVRGAAGPWDEATLLLVGPLCTSALNA